MFIMIIYNDNCMITCTEISFLNYIQFFILSFRSQTTRGPPSSSARKKIKISSDKDSSPN